jgi:two-component system cell cycle response regulator
MTYNQTKIRARALDYSNQGIVITDPNQPDNPIVDVNEAFTKMTGYTPEDILGKNCRFMQANETDNPYIDELRAAIAERKSCTVLLKNFRKDGTMFWNELSVSPVFDDAKELIYFIGIQQDVTDEQDLIQELKVTNEQLESINKMMVDRELKMVALKSEIEALKKAH